MNQPAELQSSSIEEDAGLPTARPPERYALVRRWVLDSSAELRDFRAGLRHEINERAREDAERPLMPVAERMVLVASELATNAIEHGRPPTTVELRQDGHDFLLAVTDNDTSTEPRVAGTRAPGAGGFGLQVARRLAVDVGWYRTAAEKVVWAEFGG
ncbi:ATP-binding protein [Cellulomonas carbonis]|nr:ATP-binding protein [Cellulomonas carbonis]